MLELGEVVKNTVVTAVSTNFLINVVLNSSLSNLWSLLATAQIFVFTPLFGEEIKFPTNAAVINNIMAQVVTFDMIDTVELVDPRVYGDLGEQEPYNLEFDNCGF